MFYNDTEQAAVLQLPCL